MTATTQNQSEDSTVGAYHLLLLLIERQNAFGKLVAANSTLTQTPPLLNTLSATVQSIQSQFPLNTPTEPMTTSSATPKFSP